MDMQLALMITRILIVTARNLSEQIEAAKKDDGKVSSDELQRLVFQTVLNTLDDLESGGKLSTIVMEIIKK